MTQTQPHPDTETRAYEDRLRTLSEASVHQHFDAFTDIAWDDPDYAVDPQDPRWKLPSHDALGGSEWYRSLPEAEQIRVGLYRQANITKVGLQFEQILISGLMNFAFSLPNGSPEFRYSTHEATEECHHTQMFQEFVNRSGQKVKGGSLFFRLASPILPMFARWVPFGFFVGVLAGEEPIDHMQKSVLRAGELTHPLLRRIMQIHIAEEARHIGFAHQYLEHNAPRLGRIERFILSLLTPVIMRWLCDEIMKPSARAQRDMGIPDDVFKEIFWESPHSRKVLRDLFADVRMLCQNTGLMNFFSRRVWKAMKIDGRPSRFRSEVASAAA
ncbi:diiron oxygenase [Nocardioides rotundus]|uniref:AurF N-oxygenase family protein n=1 Tax=Nocardioides rotundus TaxID=1774216 RepID=UPI001CBD04C2|nr:diiron oxygenase [Nocardioides rotundus]UAL31261.1 diiron oxygenase [Nocardioides rotundus]